MQIQLFFHSDMPLLHKKKVLSLSLFVFRKYFPIRQPPPDGGGGTALAVTEGGKKCSLLLILSLEDSMVYCSDSYFSI